MMEKFDSWDLSDTSKDSICEFENQYGKMLI